MANNIISSSIIVSETLRILHNSSAFLGNINTQYNNEFAKTGAKAGATISVRRPVQYTIRNGATANLQDVNETTVPVTVAPEFGIDWAFSDFDLSLSVDNFSDRYLKPAGSRLASELDYRMGQLYKQVSNFTGTPGTPPATAQAALNAAVKLDDNAAPRDDERTFAISPLVNSNLVGDMRGLFNNQELISKQFKSGLMKTGLGMNFQMSQNLPTHLTGVGTGTPLVNGVNQGIINTGSTDNPYAASTVLETDGWTVSTTNILRAGDVITIGGVFAVNPETKQSTGALQQFVVVSDASSGATTGPATLTISPAIIAGGAYQNVTVRPADNAVITVVSGANSNSYGQNILFHKDAFTLATVDMELPKGMDMAERAVHEGVSLRFVRGYDITTNKRICRFDILAAFAALRPEWAVRVTS